MTLTQQEVKEKLDRIVELVNARADAEIVKGEEAMGNGQGSFAAIGFATGARFVRDVIYQEFNLLYIDDDDEDGAEWLIDQAGMFDSNKEVAMEMTLKQRLQSVIEDIEDQAADKLKAAFPELFGDKRHLGDEPIEPFHYIDSNRILFYDAYGRHYFWDHLFLDWNGPFDNNVEACKALRNYKGVEFNV